MKKLLAFVLAALMMISLLPMAVMAEAPASVKIKIYNGTAADFTLTLADGDEVYLVAGEGNIDLIKWTEAEAPTDKFVKFEYAADTGVLKTTYNNLVTDQTEADGYTCHGTWYQAGDYKVDIELIGTNSLTHGKSSSIKFENTGDITISGAGSLEVTQNGTASGAIWCAGGGNLTIKNTNLKFTINSGESALHHAFYMGKGSVSIEGTKINALTMGGRLVYFGTNTAKTGRYTLDTDETRKLSIKDCEITAKAGKTVFSTASSATIENSTLKLTLSGSSGPVIEPAPTFVGDFSAIAGLAKNAEKLDKLKVYDAKKLGSYTYFYAVPGIVELLPTEPEPTIPEVTEPEATTPEETIPGGVTQPVTQPTEPETTTPTESKPTTDNKPSESKPATNSKPDATDPTEEGNGNNGGGALGIVLIILVVLVVLAGGAFVVIIILKKKKAQ